MSTADLTSATLPDRVWQALQRAPLDKHHEWRTPVLATVDAQGRPQARTVVLRQADRDGATLTCFTDARSPKCAELRERPQATLLFWSPRLGWQLRAEGTARVITDGPLVDAAWARVRTSPAASDYLAPHPPGHALGDDTDNAPATASTATDTHHLAVLQIRIDTMDWLLLDRPGHRRARIEGERVDWLVP